jgi:hypothetical protein
MLAVVLLFLGNTLLFLGLHLSGVPGIASLALSVSVAMLILAADEIFHYKG